MDLASPQIQQPEWVEQLVRAGDVKGDTAQQLLMQVQPGIDVDSMQATENRYLRRMGQYAGWQEVTPAAGQLGACVWVVKPEQLNDTLCVIDKVLISNLSAATDYYHVAIVSDAVGGGANAGGVRDARQNVGAFPALRGYTRAGVVALTAISSSIKVAVNPGVTLVLDVGFVLTNKQYDNVVNIPKLVVENQTVVRQVSAGIVWRERQLLTSER